jgi:hypothetical protein
MPTPPRRPTGATARLRELLDSPDDRVREQLVAEACARSADDTSALLASLVDREVAMPTGSAVPVRAAQLAGALGLSPAAPALARCVEAVPSGVRLHEAAVTALLRLGAQGVAALRARLDACDAPEGRTRLADALAHSAASNDELRPAFVALLADDPVSGARHLADRGDVAALPDLSRALHRLCARPIADCLLCEAEQLLALASAIRALGGSLTTLQEEHIEDVVRRSEALWTVCSAPATPVATPPAARRRRRSGGGGRLH